VLAHAATLPGTSRSHTATMPITASVAPPDSSGLDAKTIAAIRPRGLSRLTAAQAGRAH